MAGAAVEIDDREVVAALRRLQQAGSRLRPALLEIGEYLLQSTEARFDAQVDPAGQPWTPLSPAYQARKKKNPNLILVLTGHLSGQQAPQAGQRAGLQAPQATETAVSVGTNLVYAATHQFGRPEQNIPARPFLGLNATDTREILTIINEHFERAARG